ncbi:MAG: DUF2285 domain-containing protein [Gammaproteobacteria bacterium]
MPAPADLIRIERDSCAELPARFSLWEIRGRKQLVHDGTRLRVCIERGVSRSRLSLAPDVENGTPFGFFIPASSDPRTAWAAAARFTARIGKARLHEDSPTSPRLTRQALVHLRALQALDAVQAGASHRDIGAVLFGADAIARRWHSDSELRAQVRHLIRRARVLMGGGYRRLLQIPAPVQEAALGR